MSSRRFSHPPTFVRLVSVALAYLLAAPLQGFNLRSVPVARATAPVESLVKRKNTPPTTTQAPRKARQRENELLVRFRQNISQAEIDALLQANGVQRTGKLRGQSGIERLRLSSGSDVEAVANLLRASRKVDFAEPNYVITADQIYPADPRYNEQWGLKNAASGGQPGADIKVEQGWQATTGSPKTVIAVLDSGIDFSHPDLRNNEWSNAAEQANNGDDENNGFVDDLHGWDFVANAAEIKDEQGHGTAVAGIIAAQGNNGIGITGVMWRASLMSVRVLDNNGTGDVAAAVEAIDYAARNGAQVINCSWGTDDASTALLEAINWAARRGLLVVTSAGNNSRDVETTPRYPASFNLNNLIAVASTDNSDLLTSFSNWGATHATIAAPGKDILTARLGGDYELMSGSSASAPFVTGVAGLVKTLRPWLSAQRTRETILQGARQIFALSGKVSSGGVVSAEGALRVLYTLPPNEGLDGDNGNNGGEHSDNGSGQSNRREGRPESDGRSNASQPNGNEFKVKPPAPTRGAPGTGLPNLDELRLKQPTIPRAPDPIPSNRCSPHKPDCSKRKSAPGQLPTDLLATALSLPSLDSLLLNNSGLVSDSPFRLFSSAAAFSSAPSPEPQSARANVALATNGSTASASSVYPGYPLNAGAAIDGDRKGLNYPQGGAWQDTQPANTFPDWLQVDFQGSKTIDEIDVYTLQDNYANPSEPSAATTFTTYGLTGYEVQYWNGSAWMSVPGGIVSSNNLVWRKFTFSPITTTGIRILTNASADGYSRVTEVEAWGTPVQPRTNLALATNGATATASSTYTGSNSPASAANNGDRRGVTFWNDNAPMNTFPDWLQIDFQGNKTLDEIDLFMVQDNYLNPVVPTETMTFSWYGLTGYEVQYWTGSAWLNVPGGLVASNNKIWRKLTFPALTTSKIRVLTSASGDGYSRLAEIEAWGPATNSLSTQSVIWTNIVGVTASGNSLSKPGATSWDAGAISTQAIVAGDGYVEFTASETNKHRMAGLSYGDSNQSWDDIDYAIYLHDSGSIKVYESGSYRGQFGTYSTGDRLRVSVEGGVVKYSKNGGVFYTSAVAPTYPLVVDTSLYSTGATIINAVISGGGVLNNFAVERVDAINRTGGSGVDLLSRNAGWNLPILGLKGRGVDLNLTLSYNSLVWTKSADGTSIKFDADNGSPSPGFRIGFPTIQARYFNSQVGVNAYLLTTSSGGHTELRQIGTSNIYESGDASYLQLSDAGNGTLTLKTMEGSQLSYGLLNGQYQCTQVKDRNGNFISVSYFPDGRIETITDTLARVLTFNYDNYLNLSSITQMWGNTTYQWATFGWGNQTVSTGFSGLTVIGPQNNSSIPVLTQVAFSDGTRYVFEYNSYVQVSTVRHYAADNHELSHTSYTHTPVANDCPRVTASKLWAENWNNNLEAVTTYSTAADYSSAQVTMPDHTIYKEMFATSGWQKRLTIGTEFWSDDVSSGGERKKWTEIAYTQDDIGLSFQKNPRVIETNIYDSALNRKRTTIEYGQYAQWGLPYLVKEYAPDAVTILRQTYTDYNLSQVYLDRHIIGLVSAVHVWDGAWQVKVGYEYDTGGDQLQATSAATTQHDASYGAGFNAGRGNLTIESHYDVTDIVNESKKLTTRLGYDTNGSIIFTRDPAGHQTDISYADSFSDNNNSRNTFAYPTRVRPPAAAGENADSLASTTQYNFYFGAVTRAQGPTPAQQSQGSLQTFEFDSIGRISKVNTLNNGAYTRYVYSNDQTSLVSFTTANDAAHEASSAIVFDGLGNVRAKSADHPGNAGHYDAQVFRFDAMNRVVQQSNPTEIAGNWQPAGDDAGDWAWTNQQYSWQGRPTLTTNQDGTTREITYEGCGCAGGQSVTVRDEVGRYQRLTSDILGRPYKTEILNWDQAHSVYSTIVKTYNSRDQVTSVRHYQGTEASGTYRESQMSFDGYGRLLTSKAPEQSSPTSYTYNVDNTLNVIQDARGATATFVYNPRHQITGVSYSAPTGVANTANVSFAYDAAGNRTSMSDGLGNATYSYDQLSRLTNETRSLSNVGTFQLQYSYNLSGELTSITDPTGAQVGYNYDKTGRLATVTGSGYANVTTYASNLQYRAWGALKTMTYGNGLALSAGYNSRLKLASFEITGRPSQYGPSTVMSSQYQYEADGRLRSAHDLLDERMDRAYSYDQAGRLQAAYSGSEARDYLTGTTSGFATGPYRQTYQLNVWNELTARTNRFWSQQDNFTASYSNGLNQNPQWQYDSSGNVLQDETLHYTWDAAGRNREVRNLSSSRIITQEQDGDGQVVKRVETNPASTTYYLHSTVLEGRIITELNAQGQKTKGYVFSGGQLLAKQENNSVEWQHANPLTGTQGESDSNGSYLTTLEADPAGINVGVEDPFIDPSPSGFSRNLDLPAIFGLADEDGNCSFSNPNCRSCSLDGLTINCAGAMARLANGSAVPAPPTTIWANGRWNIVQFDFNRGRYGFMGWEWITDHHNPQPEDTGDGILRINNQGQYVRTWTPFPDNWSNLSGADLSWLTQQNPQPTQTREQQRIADSRQNVIDILNSNNGNNPCAQLYGGAANAIAAFSQIPFRPGALPNYRTGISMNIPIGPVAAGTTSVTPSSAIVNTNGAFFRTSVIDPVNHRPAFTPNFGGYGSNNNRSRALQMLHELGHVIVTGRNNDGTPIFLLPLDGLDRDPTGALSRQNTDTVVHACETQLNALN